MTLLSKVFTKCQPYATLCNFYEQLSFLKTNENRVPNPFLSLKLDIHIHWCKMYDAFILCHLHIDQKNVNLQSGRCLLCSSKRPNNNENIGHFLVQFCLSNDLLICVTVFI